MHTRNKRTYIYLTSINMMTSVINMASASEPAALLVKNASLKDAANRATMKLRYAKWVKEEHLEVAFLSGSDVFPTGIGKIFCYACLFAQVQVLCASRPFPSGAVW